MALHDLWYLTDRARFLAELTALSELSGHNDWLTVGHPRLDENGSLVVECDIDIGQRLYSAVLRYPALFPLAPPTVCPRDGASRWSAHQFGDGGDLCLEYRPDNWSPDVTGAQMVESAYHLLHGENPAPCECARVLSAHAVTEGQRLRSVYQRLLITPWALTQFADVVAGQQIQGTSILISLAEAGAVWLLKEVRQGDEGQIDPSVPINQLEAVRDDVTYIRRLAADERLPLSETRDKFVADLALLNLPFERGFFIFLKNDAIHGFMLYDTSVWPVGAILPSATAIRLHPQHANLGQRKVAVLGCGSLGSKVTTSLARSGVGSFLLIDDDVLTPDNLVRHDLDWRDVGLHKVDALTRRIGLVQPGTSVTQRRSQLGGQESSTSAESVLVALSNCDLIVDTTANAEVGTILSGFAQRTGVRVIWGEVFAGGVGGLIARYRPGIEPPILLMRRAIENWFAANDPTALDARPPPDEPYGDRTLIADDGDVSTIASAMTRMVLDTLLARDPTSFPHSIYVIGMAPDALFSQAFDTHPILLPEAPPETAEEPLTPDQDAAAQAMLLDVIKNSAIPS